ncbi:DivIVA domain-containing protein [Nocardia sp. NEAU-351]|uniref:DivIVA domain-containing protein n=1 Tax=Nocardia bovistercoris TaxID=2785916 RepID=A0A931MZ88_9NOCA|nr:DivIVA domain-containing protein [Nocardia bovistercoris]
MLTLLVYVLFVGLVAVVLFLLASAVFGRGEELGPLPEGTTATVLPAEGISGADVRALRFQQAVRGYKAGEVDWVLARLAARIDELQSELAQTRGATIARGGSPFPAQPLPPRPAWGVTEKAADEVSGPLAGLTGPRPAVSPDAPDAAPEAPR